MSEEILCVDDEPAVLAGFKRTLRSTFAIETAEGGQAGLAEIAANGPYAVVVSDMSMPGMNGIEFLSEVQKMAPDTVRIMLTGHTDHETASAAINEGRIFRFLIKPCDLKRLAEALKAGIEQYRYLTAENELVVDMMSAVDEESRAKCFAAYHAKRWPTPTKDWAV